MRLAAVLLIVLMFACKEKPQAAETETDTTGNATDRNAGTARWYGNACNGDAADVTVTLKPGTYTVYCPVDKGEECSGL